MVNGSMSLHPPITHKARDRICTAALEEFASKGFDGANVARIAASAGVSQPSVHYHFQSKDALWQAAMSLLHGQLVTRQQTRRQGYSVLSPFDQLKTTCIALIEQSAASPVLGRIILSEGQTGGERFDWLMQNVLSDVYFEFLQLIERCLEEGLIKAYRPHHILMLLHGAAVTQFNVAPLTAALFGENCREPGNVTAFSQLYVDVIFSGLAQNKEGP